MIVRCYILLQKILPQHWLTRIIGKMADWRRPRWLVQAAIKYYIRIYRVNMSESRQSSYRAFATFNDFFIRQLKDHARPIATHPQSIISPVDGVISQIGKLNQQQIIQAKGHNYSVRALMSDDHYANRFKSGSFLTAYLSPRDYHRIHAPFDGVLQKMVYIPGELYSVNTTTTKVVPDLFARNERVVCIFTNEQLGTYALIAIGAIIVGSIVMNWHGVVTPSRHGSITTWDYANDHRNFKRADELGYFKLGSSVILLFEHDRCQWKPHWKSGDSLHLGEVMN